MKERMNPPIGLSIKLVNGVVRFGIASFVVHLGHHEEDEFLVVVSVAQEHKGNHHVGSECSIRSLETKLIRGLKRY